MSVDTAGAAQGVAQPTGARVSDYLALLKPRVVALVVLTTLVGMSLAPGALHPVLAFTAVLCVAVGAGAAGAINMWYERDIDAVMARTRRRPLPAGRMEPGAALAFGVMLAVGAVTMMGLAVNLMAAALLALAIAFYVFVYTVWLKRRTPQNIVIGGAAGALAPVIGWAAVTGQVDLAPLVMFAIIFVWTPPHFWALSLERAGEYAKAGVPMLPVVAGPERTQSQILLYTMALVPVSLAPIAVGLAGSVYALGASALGVVFVVLAWDLRRGSSRGAPRRLFAFSILYLAAVFVLLFADRGLTFEA
ncbi:MAG: heme o synthase [Alphaproteobacteria bacterium]